MHSIHIKDFIIGDKDSRLTVISGPCVIESEEHCLMAARKLKEIYSQFDVNFIFKSSYDKANRSSVEGFRGPGIKEGLRILARVKEELDLPVLTDVHSPEDSILAALVCDMIQIPAFLCRQTDLVVAAAKTGCPMSVKKGQFMAPGDMQNVVDKVMSTGNNQIMLTDRGTSFGYNTLVSDMRSIPIMKNMGFPICFDATHSVQQPGGLGKSSGGQREFIPTLTYAAMAAGANVLFMEAHDDPSVAKSDAASVVAFKDIPEVIKKAVQFYNIAQK